MRLAVVAGIAFGVSGGAVALSSSQGSPPGSHPAPSASAERQAIAAAEGRAIPRALKREFRVFRGGSTRAPKTSIPVSEQAFLAADIHGLNVSDAGWVAAGGG